MGVMLLFQIFAHKYSCFPYWGTTFPSGVLLFINATGGGALVLLKRLRKTVSDTFMLDLTNN